eukprot:TRINITY_DN22289_c0_g1_i1.p1 TRINITY_DN22289_c0_g1~~TRINITY_DN22289_c0_g1_i1.p1  ORF type:complete len:201 (-),score=56.96 TRINITY_DN22289_c0_g1_i1:28-630(-)
MEGNVREGERRGGGEGGGNVVRLNSIAEYLAKQGKEDGSGVNGGSNVVITKETLNDENKGSFGGFPIKGWHFAKKVDGVATEFVVTFYSDQIFILITQLKKVGTIIKVTQDDTAGEYDELSGEPNISLRVLLGKRDSPEIEILARQLGQLWSPKPILLCTGIKNLEKTGIKRIVDIIKEERAKLIASTAPKLNIPFDLSQ